MIPLREAWADADTGPPAGRFVRDNGSGLAGSAILHGVLLFLILFVMARNGTPLPQTDVHFVPVQLVRLGPETTAPPSPQKSAIPQQRAAHIPVPQSASPRPPVGTAPRKTAPAPVDDLEAKLRGLAKLRQPDAPLHAPDNAQTADTDATSAGAAPGDAAYSLRDYIRAQVERRWSLNLAMLGNRKLTIQLRVEIKRDGTVVKSEIVDQVRFRKDFAFHEIALSARNAVLLSSPFALPPGDYQNIMDMTLNLDPRDTLR